MNHHHRYRLPLIHCGTNRSGRFAVGWLKEQWDEVMALRSAGVPVEGFAWYPLVDAPDLPQGARLERWEPQPIGLCDSDRRIRPVGEAYRELISRWSAVVGAPRSALGATGA